MSKPVDNCEQVFSGVRLRCTRQQIIIRFLRNVEDCLFTDCQVIWARGRNCYPKNLNCPIVFALKNKFTSKTSFNKLEDNLKREAWVIFTFFKCCAGHFSFKLHHSRILQRRLKWWLIWTLSICSQVILVWFQRTGNAGNREVLGQECYGRLKTDWAVSRWNLAFCVAIGGETGGWGKEKNIWFLRDRRWNLENI